MKTTQRKLNILVLIPKEHQNDFKFSAKHWDKYFEVDVMYDVPSKLPKYVGKQVDILFLWKNSKSTFNISYYKEFQEASPKFKYIVIKNDYEETDYNIFKLLADDILYVKDHRLAKWKSLAILRRYWNTYSKDSTLIYKDIIADFVDDKVTVNGKEIELTKKELKLLKHFMDNIGVFIPKNQIFKTIWGFEEDISRALDQMIFKLKKKIGPDYFHSSRKEGFKFE